MLIGLAMLQTTSVVGTLPPGHTDLAELGLAIRLDDRLCTGQRLVHHDHHLEVADLHWNRLSTVRLRVATAHG